jgi:flagellum-specific peptidoglycan hydrolase FlgJ
MKNNFLFLLFVLMALQGCMERHDEDMWTDSHLDYDCAVHMDSMNFISEEMDSAMLMMNKYAYWQAVIDGTVSSDVVSIRDKFILRFLETAKAEKEKYGIPISIKLGQAILESRSGTSRLAREANNFFCVKCHARSCSKGHCINHADDSHKDFFKVYESAWASFRAHSVLLANQKIGPYSDEKRYAACFDCGDDYVCWANELSKAGYATDPKYSKKLIKLIEKEGLNHFDNMHKPEDL